MFNNFEKLSNMLKKANKKNILTLVSKIEKPKDYKKSEAMMLHEYNAKMKELSESEILSEKQKNLLTCIQVLIDGSGGDSIGVYDGKNNPFSSAMDLKNAAYSYCYFYDYKKNYCLVIGRMSSHFVGRKFSKMIVLKPTKQINPDEYDFLVSIIKQKSGDKDAWKKITFWWHN